MGAYRHLIIPFASTNLRETGFSNSAARKNKIQKQFKRGASFQSSIFYFQGSYKNNL
jgi:hypothetical protein